MDKKNIKNKIIKARVTEYEESLVKEKARYYGYKSLSKYLIDAAIYEKITVCDLKNEQLIYDAYAKNTKEINKVIKEIRLIRKFATQLNNDNIKNLNSLLFSIIRKQNEMIELIDKKLDLDVWEKINRENLTKEAS